MDWPFGIIRKIFTSLHTTTEVGLHHRIYVATKHLLTRCENSSQNLGCSKTSTSNTCLTEEKDNSQLQDICDNSIECCKRVELVFDRCETSP